MNVFLTNLSGLFSGSIVLSGLLPALITLVYALIIVTRFDGRLVTDLWATGLTMTTFVFVLAVTVLTFVFEAIHPLLRQWLAGSWVPEWWLRRRQGQRLELEMESFQAKTLWHEGIRQLELWQTSVRDVLYAAERRPRGVAPPLLEEEARVVTDLAKTCFPRPETALAEVQIVRDAVMGVVADVETAGVPWPAALFETCQVVIVMMEAVKLRLTDNVGKMEDRLRTPFPSNEAIQGTLFGNLLTSVNRYAFTVYGMNTELLWPRLREAAKNADGWKALDHTRSMVDFLVAAVWIHVAVFLFAFLALPLLVRRDPALLVALLVLGATLRVVFYRAALQSVQAYGLQVATAFDLHRWMLLDALRVPRPSNSEDETRLWKQITTQLVPTSPRRSRWYR